MTKNIQAASHQMKTWDDLYAGWEGDEYKYYWRDFRLDVVPFTYEWYDRRDEKAIAMGEAGDPEASVALENITLKRTETQLYVPGHKELYRATSNVETIRVLTRALQSGQPSRLVFDTAYGDRGFDRCNLNFVSRPVKKLSNSFISNTATLSR